jgi:hypothetical protein
MVASITNSALGTLQRIPVREIVIDDAQVNLSSSEIKQVRVSLTENKHDAATITTQLSKAQIDTYAGKTISFSYGPGSRRSMFYGYVLTVTPAQGYQTDTVVDINCLGTTWPMQSGQPRFFVNRTVPSIVAEIVRGYDLGVQVDEHQYVFSALAQTNESDWEFIRALAARIGYAIYIYGGLVRLVDPSRVQNETGIFQHYIKADDILDTSRGLLEFTPTTQSLNIRDNLQPAFGFLEAGEGRLSQALDRPFRLDTNRVVRDREMAEVYTEAWNRNVNAWNHQAAARINGDARLTPGITISVKVSATRSGINEHDGTWLVRGIEHSISHNSFQSQLSLARDDTPAPFNPDFRWFYATGPGEPRVLRSDALEPRWVSSWRHPQYIQRSL